MFQNLQNILQIKARTNFKKQKDDQRINSDKSDTGTAKDHVDDAEPNEKRNDDIVIVVSSSADNASDTTETDCLMA